MLDRKVAQGRVSIAQIREIAARLAAFHRVAAVDQGWKYGSAAAVWRLVRGNLEELADDRADAIAASELDELERFAHRVIELRWSLLNRRALGGRVCEGHGDLRCEHVSLDGETIRIIDCVEFSEGLRYVDVASDLGFLAMDLDRLGARGLSDELVGAYRESSGDADLPLLIPFYKFIVRWSAPRSRAWRVATPRLLRTGVAAAPPHAATSHWRSISRVSRAPH